VRVASHPVTCDTEASYTAWIAPIPPSARHPYQRYQVRYQDGNHQRSAGIFPTQRLALAEKRAIDRGDRDQPQPVTDPDPQKTRMPFGEYLTTKWWPAWKDQHPARPARRGDRRALPGAGADGGADRDALGRIGRPAAKG
jgi:hypothetical protein